jgi:hypothetical protein
VPKLRVPAARRAGLASDGTRIVGHPGLADAGAADTVPVQRLVGHLFHASLTFALSWTASARGGTARGTGGEQKKLTRVLEATMNGPSG